MTTGGTPHKALVTGATGFIGSRLVHGLAATGWEVAALVRPSSVMTAFPPGIKVLVHDGTTGNLIDHLGKTQPDVVFHLAARFIAGHQSDDIVPLLTDNLLFSTQLFEAAALAKVKGLINTGTCWQHYEGKGYAPVNLYAATKQAAADLLRYYAEATELKTMTLELVDTYGGGDPRKKLFYLLRQAAKGGEVLEMSPGEQLIDLVHVDDVVNAYQVAAQRLLRPDTVTSECWGVTSLQPLELREVVERFRQLNGGRPQVVWGRRPYRYREVMIPYSAPILPGWQPMIGLDAGLQALLRDEAE